MRGNNHGVLRSVSHSCSHRRSLWYSNGSPYFDLQALAYLNAEAFSYFNQACPRSADFGEYPYIYTCSARYLYTHSYRHLYPRASERYSI